MAISISGLFAVVTSLFIAGLLARLDRKVVLGCSRCSDRLGAVAFAPDFYVLMFGAR